MDEPKYIICLKITDEGDRTEGSTVIPCCRCKEQLSISPASMKLLVEKNIAPICFPCAEAINPPGEEMQVVPPTPEQQQEIITEMKRRK